MFDKIHAKRLTQLADHLEKGKLGHKRFDFSIVTNSEGDACGSAGCAIGECPIVFPEHFVFNLCGVKLRNPVSADTVPDPFQDRSFFAAQAFFGLTSEETSYLFAPGYELNGQSNKLTYASTRYDVAAKIRWFLEYKARETEEGP